MVACGGVPDGLKGLWIDTCLDVDAPNMEMLDVADREGSVIGEEGVVYDPAVSVDVAIYVVGWGERTTTWWFQGIKLPILQTSTRVA